MGSTTHLYSWGLVLTALIVTGCDPKPGKPTTVGELPSVTQQVAAQQAGQPVPQVVPAPTATQPAQALPQDGPPPVYQPAPPAVQAQAPAQAAPAPVRTAQAAAQPAKPAANPALRGEVRSIEAIHERPKGTGKGAVVGGVLGAVVGNQFGSHSGRAAMTVLGAAGGAVAGNNVERNMNKQIVGYRVSVQLDNGQTRTYEEKSLNGLQIGDRVRVDRGHLRRA